MAGLDPATQLLSCNGYMAYGLVGRVKPGHDGAEHAVIRSPKPRFSVYFLSQVSSPVIAVSASSMPAVRASR